MSFPRQSNSTLGSTKHPFKHIHHRQQQSPWRRRSPTNRPDQPRISAIPMTVQLPAISMDLEPKDFGVTSRHVSAQGQISF